MPDITNYDGRLEQMAEYCESMYVLLAKNNNTYYDDVKTIYKASLPSKYVDLLDIKSIGGKTLLWNQLCKPINSTYWLGGNDYTDGVFTFTSANIWGACRELATKPTIAGHVCLLIGEFKFNEIPTSRYGFDVGNTGYRSSLSMDLRDYATQADEWFTAAKIGTYTTDAPSPNVGCYVIDGSSGTHVTIQGRNVMLVDLTAEFGAGNEPETVEQFKEMFPDDLYEYNPGTLLPVCVTSVISKDGDDTVLQTVNISAKVQALEGYGWSCPTAYNYIDFTNKKFVQAVASRAYETGDESDATVITDGTNTHYELDTPLEFDVDLPDNIITKVESGGSLTFENQLGDNYRVPVPVELEYIGV